MVRATKINTSFIRFLYFLVLKWWPPPTTISASWKYIELLIVINLQVHTSTLYCEHQLELKMIIHHHKYLFQSIFQYVNDALTLHSSTSIWNENLWGKFVRECCVAWLDMHPEIGTQNVFCAVWLSSVESLRKLFFSHFDGTRKSLRDLQY